jgi:tRNA threonylcarbamoyladenosine biosynthesis protein TsaB
MKILAIETTDQAGSAALMEGERAVAERRLEPRERSAQWLAPAIRDLLAAGAWQPSDVRLIGVAIGPGSFTGLRVGVTTAKTFAYAVGCDVIGVPTLEVIAAQVAAEMPPGSKQLPRPQIAAVLSVVLDAGRQQVFSARFRPIADGRLEWMEPTALVDDAVWLAGLQPGELIAGPGLRKFSDRLPKNAIVAPTQLWAPGAATVGRLALGRYQSGQRDDLWSLAPQYFRASAAEEKAAAAKGVVSC